MSASHGKNAEQTRYFDQLIELFERGIPFNTHLGMRVVEMSPGLGVIRVPFGPELIGDPIRQAIHGGVTAALIDAAGGLAAFTSVHRNDRVSTVDMRVDYLRAGVCEDLWAEGRVLRTGNRVVVTDMLVFQGDRTDPIATGRGVYNIKKGEL